VFSILFQRTTGAEVTHRCDLNQTLLLTIAQSGRQVEQQGNNALTHKKSATALVQKTAAKMVKKVTH